MKALSETGFSSFSSCWEEMLKDTLCVEPITGRNAGFVCADCARICVYVYVRGFHSPDEKKITNIGSVAREQGTQMEE